MFLKIAALGLRIAPLVIVGNIMVLVYESWDWQAVAKVYGPLGVISLVALLAIWKILVPWIQRQQEDYKNAVQKSQEDSRTFMQAALDDARKDRDYSRQLREADTDKFMTSLKLRDEQQSRESERTVKALEEMARAIRDAK